MKRALLVTAALLVCWLAVASLSESNQKRPYHTAAAVKKRIGDNILLEGTAQETARFEKWLDQIADVPKGYQTLKAIAESDHELTIRHSTYAVISAGRTLAPLSANLTNGKGESVTILFNAHIQDGGSHMVYNSQRKLIEYTAIQNLYHELAHAMHMLKGSWRYFASEEQAIEEENLFRRELASMQNTPLTERWRQNGVLISNVDDIFVTSEWFGPSVLKMPEPLQATGKAHQTATGAETKVSEWQPER